jgi:type I restriction enzyme S subunit
MHCMDTARIFEGMPQGATVFHTSAEKIANCWACLPPIEEQEAIAAYVESTDATMRAVLDSIRQSVDRLREYRQALITAAVTGKIDVPKEAA